MRSGKGSQEYEEYEEEDLNFKKDGPSSNVSNSSNSANPKDKSSDKANAIRSKHSVTEQRRRSKINERFQILRDLIPHSDQKRDTASFLLEVIEYVRYLQEKVHKYEDSYQGWSSEPTKLMPWRNSHWRVQSVVSPPQAMKNGSGPVSSYPGKLEETGTGTTSNMLASSQNTSEIDPGRDLTSKFMVQQSERPFPDAQPTECTADTAPDQHEDLTIEGGTISISSVYSQGLLNSLTNALQTAGVDLSQARISVQIDLGKRADRGALVTGTSIPMDHGSPNPGNSTMAHVADARGEEASDQAQKRQKT
ncbi:transcription factor BIM2 isoform X2 [Rhodamnia argentea]|uniref:Transcription factor BIM2 isoform X2 n=1 Tax=Rhodamnia argentea TaxID=178133 RepID=A0A8B8MVA0_9MYRT|nr:transcription factor BIM2 isoform X2 [Rhodamnia argentea]